MEQKSPRAPEGKVSKEQIENQLIKEKLSLSLLKLREIISKLPAGSRDRARAEHTLRSTESALVNSGKNGSPQGKYSVAVEGYPGNPASPYTQQEGIPVDELIDILKNSAKELKKNISTKDILSGSKKKVQEMDEQYKMANEVTDKAIKYSKWEEARKAYEKIEELYDGGKNEEARKAFDKFAELYDLNLSKESQELENLAGELYKNSEGYFEAHYTKAHGEGDKAWTAEEKNKQDLRTRHEAKYISSDYRNAGNEEENYKAAMEVLKYRRELKLKEEPVVRSLPNESVVAPVAPLLSSKPIIMGDPWSGVVPPIPSPAAVPPIPKQNLIPRIEVPRLKKEDFIEKTAEKSPTSESIPPIPETMSLDKSRDDYLKAKRLRGNIARGFFGKLLGRTLNFGGNGQPGSVLFAGEKMDFGGKQGIRELERVRMEYQEGLSRYRRGEITRMENDLAGRLTAGTISEAQANAERQTRIVGLLSEEQENIDKRAVDGIERNIFEKMKTKWRQFNKTRFFGGALLGIAGAATGGTAIGAGIVGARAIVGGVGTYVGVEAGLERYSKWLGHKGGLLRDMKKEMDKRNSVTGRDLDMYLATVPPEEIRKEAARLRMLQVEKGVSINNLHTLGDDGKMAAIILRMDNELTAKEVMAAAGLTDPSLGFADVLSSKLAMEINLRNELVESEVDKERLKKLARKTIAAVAGAGVGWLIGGKLLPEWGAGTGNPANPPLPPSPGIPFAPGPTIPPFMPDHVVSGGENLWDIIETDLDSHRTLAGLGEGTRTHVIDALKDMFDKMSPTELQNLGFSSGDADILQIGDSLDLGRVLDNPPLIANALFNANNLSPAEITQIVNNNTQISTWFAAHHQELRQVFDSSVIDEVLRGIR